VLKFSLHSIIFQNVRKVKSITETNLAAEIANTWTDLWLAWQQSYQDAGALMGITGVTSLKNAFAEISAQEVGRSAC